MRAGTRAAMLLAGGPVVLGAAGVPDARALDGYPARPVRIIVPAPPGAHPDLAARPVAGKLGEALGQAFLVENRPGASGTLGVHSAVRAAPDGYTVLVGDLAQITRLGAQPDRFPYDAGRDLVAIAKLAEVPHALFVHPSLPVANVRELVALARAKPGQLTYGAAGSGSFTDAVTDALNQVAGIRLARVKAASGARPVDALLAGETMLAFEALHPRLDALRHKRLRALAVGTSRRVDAAPSVPTFAEAGLGEFLASPWLGLFAPSRTPHGVVAKLEAATAAAIEQREVRRLFERAGLEPARTPRERFSHQVRDDIARFDRVARGPGEAPGR